MKNIKSKLLSIAVIFAVLVSGFSLSSCDDEAWLEDNGFQSNGFSEPVKTADLETMLDGAYYMMGGDGGWKGYHGNQQICPTFMSDEGWLYYEKAGTDDISWYENRDQTNPTEGRHERHWRFAYVVILECNKIIEHLETQGAFGDRYGELWKDRQLGEAYFLRAYAYHELVKVFGKPYGSDNSYPACVLTTAVPESAFDNQALSSVGEVYDQIVADVQKAAILLPEEATDENGPTAYGSPGRVKKSAAHFLAARVFFQMHDYSKAEAYSDSVLMDNNVTIDVTEDPLETWNKQDYFEKSSEVVWYYINSNPQTRWKPPIQSRYYGYTSDGRQDRPNTGQKLAVADHAIGLINWADTIEAKKDKRYTQLFISYEPGQDPRAGYDALTERKVWCNKWYRAPFEGGWPRALVTSLPLMRSAEIYLTRAWCRMENGDAAGAAADLNVIRQRAFDETEAGVTFENSSRYVTAATVTKQMIENERLVEMMMEGDRLYFLQAIQKDIPAGDRTNTTSDYPWGNFSAAIPQYEVDNNPEISQRD